MARVIRDAAIEPVVRVLLGAMDVDCGPTDEQHAVLDPLVSGLWSDHAVESGAPHTARAGRGRTPRSRTPRTAGERSSCSSCSSSAAIRWRRPRSSGPRRTPKHFTAPAPASRSSAISSARASRPLRPTISATSTKSASTSPRYRCAGPTTTRRTPDPELAQRLHALHDLPPGTLGHEYVEFYRRNDLVLPGDDPSSPAVFVSHDMCHVIGGYEPTGPGEIALGGMQLAIADTDTHWIQFIGNLGVHEAGYLGVHAVAKQATLARPGAAATLADSDPPGRAVHRRLHHRRSPRDGGTAARRCTRRVRRPADRLSATPRAVAARICRGHSQRQGTVWSRACQRYCTDR